MPKITYIEHSGTEHVIDVKPGALASNDRDLWIGLTEGRTFPRDR